MTFGSFQKQYKRMYETMGSVKRLVALKLKEAGYKQNIIAKELDVSPSSISMAVGWDAEDITDADLSKAARGKKVFDVKVFFPRTYSVIQKVLDFTDVDAVLDAFYQESCDMLGRYLNE